MSEKSQYPNFFISFDLNISLFDQTAQRITGLSYSAQPRDCFTKFVFFFWKLSASQN